MAVDMELEKVLRPPEFPQAPYPPKVITLANGKKMVVREVTRADIPELLKSVHPTLFIDRDYYNVVGARVYAELIAWQYYRVQNEYVIVGQIDGLVAGIVNGRMFSPQVGMSLHTLAIDRGLRIGAHLFAAKMEHHIEYLNQDEVLIVAESPIGFRRWMIEYGLEPTNIPHELGGAPSYKLTRELYFKSKPRLVVGDRPVPQELMDVAMRELTVADAKAIREKIAGLKGR
ncbi:MAG TPA: hypothetical protein PKZ84_07310 [Anaerolineae bacterium]|nr:hypothetical protein [Anaerolineae bacterium]HQI84190.1 hypothetical protein [Anaerolineae bacterium]